MASERMEVSMREARTRAVGAAIARMRALCADGLTCDALERILTEVEQLAACASWWAAKEYPAPELPELQARYRIAEDADHSFALYLNVMRAGKKITPHNHTTWACIAAVEGVEINRVFRRTDDGTRPGIASLALDRTVMVQPGSGIALMPDDIHSVQIEGAAPIRHLHMYGRALETLTERVTFDLEAGTCGPMGIGVATRSA